MKIIPVGVNGPFPMPGGATSCYLIESGTHKLVIDLGSGALSALGNYARMGDISAFVLTHLHYDHFCDALTLGYHSGTHRIFAPCTPAECFCLLKSRKNFDVKVITDSLRAEIGGMRLEFERTNHSVECYAVKVTEGERSFVYTSDTMWSDKLLQFCEGASLIIADCSGDANKPHMTADEGGMIARATGARLIATHIPPDKVSADKYKAACEKAGITLIERGKELRV